MKGRKHLIYISYSWAKIWALVECSDICSRLNAIDRFRVVGTKLACFQITNSPSSICNSKRRPGIKGNLTRPNMLVLFMCGCVYLLRRQTKTSLQLLDWNKTVVVVVAFYKSVLSLFSFFSSVNNRNELGAIDRERERELKERTK